MGSSINFTSADVPKMTPATGGILQHNKIILPEGSFPARDFYSRSHLINQGLHGRLSYLEKMQDRLIHAQKQPVRDRIIATLATAFALAIVAATVLGIVYLTRHPTLFDHMSDTSIFFAAPGMVLGGLAVFIGYFALNIWYFGKWADEDGPIRPDGVGGVGMLFEGPFVPLYKTFGNIGRYEKSIAEISPKLEAEIASLKQQYASEESRKPLRELHEKLVEAEKAQALSQQAAPSKEGAAYQKQLQEAVAQMETLVKFLDGLNSPAAQ